MTKKTTDKKLFRTKEHGIKILKATIEQIATSKKESPDAAERTRNILYVKEKIKREMLMSKIHILEADEPEQIDLFPDSKELTICLNPYYELAVVRNLRPFPVLLDSPDAIKWLSNIDTYLAMNLLYYRDNNVPLPSVDHFNYTNAELLEARELLVDYYDLENPKTNPLEANPNVSYYHPFPGLVQSAENDVAEYEKSNRRRT